MYKAKLSWIILILLSTFSISVEAYSSSAELKLESGGIPTGQLRGHQRINQEINLRYVDQEYYHFIQVLGVDSYSLLPLLGGFQGSSPIYSNGNPNSVNMLLWPLIFQKTASLFAIASCEENFPYPNLRAQLKDTLEQLCAANIDKDDRLDLLDEVWMAVMAYSGSYEDYQEFIKHFAQESFWQLDPKERVEAALISLWTMPGYLLEP